MLRTFSHLALVAALLTSSSISIAAQGHRNESSYQAVCQQNASFDRTTGYTGPGAGSANASQLDRSATTEG